MKMKALLLLSALSSSVFGCEHYTAEAYLVYLEQVESQDDLGALVKQRSDYIKSLGSSSTIKNIQDLTSNVSVQPNQESTGYNEAIISVSLRFDASPEAVTTLYQSKDYLSLDISQQCTKEN